jgi:SAM-dependent methyltransferase
VRDAVAVTDANADVPTTFGSVAELYAAARPTYPGALFDWLADVAPARDLAWDCGCGNGQAAVGLAKRFTAVVATDASAEQIAAAPPHDRIAYRIAPAQDSGLATHAADLVTVAQALHWFPLEEFYAEVRRVARPGAVVAAWSYHWLTTGDARIDAIVDQLATGTLAGYWPVGREHVDNAYVDLEFPFVRIDPPPLAMTQDWPLDRLLTYLRSWSSVSRYRDQHGVDPVDEVAPALATLWGSRAATRPVRWPLTVLAGRCP